MNCPKCQAELPETARFCGMCGTRFNSAPQPGVPSPKEEAKAASPGDNTASLRFFQDQTGQTNTDDARRIMELAQAAMKGTPSPSENPVAAAVAAAVAADQAAHAPPSEPAAPAPETPEASVDPVTGKPFDFRMDELARALGRAALKEGKPPPAVGADDVTAYYRAGAHAGLSRSTLEACLHEVATERAAPAPVAPKPVTANALPAANISGPMTDEFEPIQPSKGKILGMVGAVVAGIVVVGWLAFGGSSEPAAPAPHEGQEAPVEGTPAATPTPAPVEKKPEPAAADKPKRKLGAMDTKLINPAIAAVADASKSCHLAAQKKAPGVEGKIIFDVELEEDGTFSKLDVKEDGIKNADMVACVKEKVRAHAWPRPTGGFFAMEFPLSFQATKPATKAAAPAPAASSKKPVKKKK